ncbi:MAG: isoleucine--tRNA ligase [Alphaproteobacteria bacterium]|nr:isoleucine--tRNA ligase [Alphaproteobacteria bacterium]
MTEDNKDQKPDYRDTVFLPKTDFPMRGGLPQKEPEIIAKWQDINLHGQLRKKGEGKEKFVLHDGPPYANGNIHMGHAVNKILKDVVVKSQTMLGKDSPYVPGWDCHGLPIEWKIEEKYRETGKDKDEVPLLEFREECRQFAKEWVSIQSEQFQRLGVTGDWDNPYLTMTNRAEGKIAREIHKFAMNGALYKGLRPVMWSVVEKTALAEAEVEYKEHKSVTIWVKFPIVQTSLDALSNDNSYIVIWTTTPWTIPSNRAIAFGKNIQYKAYKVKSVDEGSISQIGEILVLAKSLADGVKKQAKIEDWEIVAEIPGDAFADMVCAHPFRDPSKLINNSVSSLEDYYGFPVPLLAGDFVTDDAGTGFVHIAPGHGEDDFNLGMKNGIEVTDNVTDDGKFRPHVALFADEEIYTQKGELGGANFSVLRELQEAGNLLAKGSLRHEYPHSWRSKAPLIFRTTPQWFIAMGEDQYFAFVNKITLGALQDSNSFFEDIDFCLDKVVLGQKNSVKDFEINLKSRNSKAYEYLNSNPEKYSSLKKLINTPTIRDLALNQISKTNWVPGKGEARINAMIANRPDWCISRQRAWGVPIALFLHKDTGDVLIDDKVFNRIGDIFEEEGSDAWWVRDAQDFLGNEYKAEDYTQVFDIVDVWFESGSTHAFVVEDTQTWPYFEGVDQIDLYLEGSDQHRGWFHSSLLESVGSRGRAPYKNVLTHGFVLDEKGYKMSKSLGNVVDPLKMMEQYGADIIRLWVMLSDYQDDIRIGADTLKNTSDLYRRLRNTLRFLLGALDGYTKDEAIDLNDKNMPELEQYMLHLLADMDQSVRQSIEKFEFGKLAKRLHDFCNQELSAFYFDIRKDRLYCDNPESFERRACRTVMAEIFNCLSAWLSPILCFTAEEAWSHRPEGVFEDVDSIHLREFPDVSKSWKNDVLAKKWEEVLAARKTVLAAIEPLRASKELGSSLEAHPVLKTNSEAVLSLAEKMPDICITSSMTVEKGDTAVAIQKADGEKCERCWRVLPEVKKDDYLCNRCSDAVAAHKENTKAA